MGKDCKNPLCVEAMACKKLMDDQSRKMETERMEREILKLARAEIEQHRKTKRNRRKRERKKYGY